MDTRAALRSNHTGAWNGLLALDIMTRCCAKQHCIEPQFRSAQDGEAKRIFSPAEEKKGLIATETTSACSPSFHRVHILAEYDGQLGRCVSFLHGK